jgi:hypothetical protein
MRTGRVVDNVKLVHAGGMYGRAIYAEVAYMIGVRIQLDRLDREGTLLIELRALWKVMRPFVIPDSAAEVRLQMRAHTMEEFLAHRERLLMHALILAYALNITWRFHPNFKMTSVLRSDEKGAVHQVAVAILHDARLYLIACHTKCFLELDDYVQTASEVGESERADTVYLPTLSLALAEAHGLSADSPGVWHTPGGLQRRRLREDVQNGCASWCTGEITSSPSRGSRARKSEKKRREAQIRHHAATALQRVVRGRAVRRCLAATALQRVVHGRAVRRCLAATALQRMARGRAVRRRLAATALQRVARGRAVRRVEVRMNGEKVMLVGHPSPYMRRFVESVSKLCHIAFGMRLGRPTQAHRTTLQLMETGVEVAIATHMAPDATVRCLLGLYCRMGARYAFAGIAVLANENVGEAQRFLDRALGPPEEVGAACGAA